MTQTPNSTPAPVPAPAPGTQRPRRWRKVLWRWTRRVLLVLAVLVLLYSFVLPWYVHRKLIAALREMGLDDSSLDVQTVSPWRAELANLRVGDPLKSGLSIGSVAVTYEPDVMGTGKYRTIAVHGAELRLAIKDGKLDLGPLANFRTKSASAKQGPFELPFQRVDLHASSLVVDWNGAEIRFPLAGSVRQTSPGHLEIEAFITAAGVPVAIHGTITENWPTVEATAGFPPEPVYDAKFDLAILGQTVQLASLYNPHSGDLSIDAGLRPRKSPLATAPATQPADSQHLHLTGNFVSSEGKRLFTLNAEHPDWIVDLPRVGEARFEGARFTIRVESIGETLNAEISAICRKALFSNATVHDIVLSIGQVDSAQLFESPPIPRSGWVNWLLKTGPIEFENSAMKLTANKSSIHLASGFDKPWHFVGFADFDSGSFVNQSAAIVVSDVSAGFPINHGFNDSGSGHFATSSIRWKERELPAISGRIGMVDGVIQADAKWSILKEAPLDLTANANLSSLSPAGEIRATLPPTAIEDESQIRKLIPTIGVDTDIDGTLGLDASLSFAHGDMTPRATLTLKDFNLRNNKQEFAAEGINGSVTLDSLAPTSLPEQKLTVKKLKAKKLALKDGEIALRVESRDSILVERTVWHFEDGGAFHVHAFRYHPSKEVAEFEAFIENINVKQWIALITNENADGEGLMYGRLPVVFHMGKKKHLEFGRGFLYANPGTGWFQIKSKAFLESAVRGASLSPGEIASEVESRIMEGLGNFEYNYLTFDFIPEKEGLLCVLVTKGKGRNPNKPVNFQGITLNIRGFDEALNFNLGLSQVGE